MSTITALSAPIAPPDSAAARTGDRGARAFAPVFDAMRRHERASTAPPAAGTILPPDGHDLPRRDTTDAATDRHGRTPSLPERTDQPRSVRPPHTSPSRPKHATCDPRGDSVPHEKDAEPRAPAPDAAAPPVANTPPPEPVPPPASTLAGAAMPAEEVASPPVAIDLARLSLAVSPNDEPGSGRERAAAEAPAPPPVPLVQTPEVAATIAAILPALQAFGAALQRAVTAERRLTTRDPSPDAVVAALAASATAPSIVLAPPAAIDTTQPQWLETMMTRIEQLRDAANAPGTSADTRIRLRPDALGTVDVTVRRDEDGVHAHFAAADPATARLLADAQPRLAELAQARGLRLTQAGVDGGAPRDFGQGDRRQPAPAPEPSRAPRSAPSFPADDVAAGDRLA